MTVSSTTDRKGYTGDGTTVAFGTSPVVFFDSSDLDVYVVTTATGVAVLKTLTTDYTVTGGAGTVGTVTMLVAPASTEKLLIVRRLPITQETDYVNNDASDAEVVEDAFDKLTMVAQQLQGQIDLAPKLADSDVSGVDLTIPTPEALTIPGWNTAGDGMVNYPVETGTSLVDLAASSGSSLVGNVYDGISAVALNLHDYIEDDGAYSVMGFVPQNLKAAIRNQTSVADLTTYMQAWVAAAELAGIGGRLPRGLFNLDGTLTINALVGIRGEGWQSIIAVNSGLGSSDDIFTIVPPTSSALQGFRFQDFYIKPASGTPGRYGISIDGTNGAASNIVIDHVRIDTLGNYAIAVINASGLATGTPFTTSVRDGVFGGGIDLTNGGDNINFTNNVCSGVRDIKIGLIGAANSDGGAHGLMLFNNNITVNGGIVITNAWQGTIAYNNIEQVATSTNANSALIDVQGNASANVQNLKIFGNYVGANSSYVTDAIRIDKATHTEIKDNFVVRGSGFAYKITANATDTDIKDNTQAPAGEAISTWLSDSGTNTRVDYMHQSDGFRTIGPSLAITSLAGTTGVAFTATQVKVNATNGLVGSASGDPSATGLDTALSRTAAGEFSMGTGSFASNAGHIVQTGSIDLGTSQVKRLRANRGTALVAGDFALSAGWGTTASVGTVIGTDQAWTITVTSAGTGQGASPTVTLTFHDGTFTNSPITVSKMTGGTGTVTTLTEAPTATTNVITFNGTPVAGSTYVISSVGIGR